MSTGYLSIKRVVAEDIDELIELSKSTFYDAFSAFNTEENMQKYLANFFSKNKMLEEINNLESEFYFAVLNNQNIGYLKLNFGKAQTDVYDSSALEIERIYISAAYQGMKAGEWLLKQTFAIAKALKKEYVWLGVWEKNEGAIRFYKRNGFVQFGKHSFMLGDDNQTDLLLKYHLTND